MESTVVALEPTSVRDRYTSFIERHEVAWELTMGVLTVVTAELAPAGPILTP